MPASPSRAQRIEWHCEHAETCGCRPVPPSLVAAVRAMKREKRVLHN